MTRVFFLGSAPSSVRTHDHLPDLRRHSHLDTSLADGLLEAIFACAANASLGRRRYPAHDPSWPDPGNNSPVSPTLNKINGLEKKETSIFSPDWVDSFGRDLG